MALWFCLHLNPYALIKFDIAIEQSCIKLNPFFFRTPFQSILWLSRTPLKLINYCLMKQIYSITIAVIIIFCFSYSPTYSQIVWTNNSGSTGGGNFTITGTGSVSTLNSASNIAFAKHVSGSSTYYTCDNCIINVEITGQLIIDYPLYVTNTKIIVGVTGFNASNSTSGLLVDGSATNPKQGLFLDNASSIQLASGSNFIKLQSTPLGTYIIIILMPLTLFQMHRTKIFPVLIILLFADFPHREVPQATLVLKDKQMVQLY